MRILFPKRKRQRNCEKHILWFVFILLFLFKFILCKCLLTKSDSHYWILWSELTWILRFFYTFHVYRTEYNYYAIILKPYTHRLLWLQKGLRFSFLQIFLNQALPFLTVLPKLLWSWIPVCTFSPFHFNNFIKNYHLTCCLIIGEYYNTAILSWHDTSPFSKNKNIEWIIVIINEIK